MWIHFEWDSQVKIFHIFEKPYGANEEICGKQWILTDLLNFIFLFNVLHFIF